MHGNNSAIEWKNWLRTFEVFIKACHHDPDREIDMCSKLLHHAGPKVQQVYAALQEESTPKEVRSGPLADGYVVEQSDYVRMVDKLNNFFAPKRNPTYERHVFRKMKHAKDEKVDLFVMKLRQQAELCELGDRLEEL